jgi:hypothetical protein
MKRISVILIIGLVLFACGEQTEPLKPLDKGAPNTVTLPNGEVVYKMDGEWNATIDYPKFYTINKDILKITQDGNKFVGNFLNGNELQDAGIEVIKGELEKNGFKSLYVNSVEGWLPATSKIDANCNKIATRTHIKRKGFKVKLDLTRK